MLRWFLGIAAALAVTAAALPFIVLSAKGVMRPTEGFCVEHGLAAFGDPPTADELRSSFFVSPELGDGRMRIPFSYDIPGIGDDGIGWPICLRSRRGHHRFWAGVNDRELGRLGEPNLRKGDQTGIVHRLLTAPSFSRLPIAFRLEARDASGRGILTVTWLEDDGQKQPDTIESGAWKFAPLPRRSLQRTFTAERTAALGVLFAQPRPPPFAPGIDGNWLVIESVYNGRRDARFVQLAPPPHSTGLLFCALVDASGISTNVLKDGAVSRYCAKAPTQSGLNPGVK